MSEKDYDSIQNFSSLECWDYSIELECLQGTPGMSIEIFLIYYVLCTKLSSYIILSHFI